MCFFSIAGVELRKLFKKPLTLVMLGTLFVPLFYTYSILTDAPLLQMTPSGALDFALGQWGLLGMTGLFQVLFSLVVVNTLSAEVDRGQIKMVVMRECARKRLIYAKMAVLTLSMILCYVVFLGFCILCYYTLVVHTDYGTGEWVSEAVRSLGLGRFAMSGLFTLLDTLMTTGIIFLFSLRYRTGICFMLAIGTTTLFLILQFFPGVRYLVPAYVGSLLDYGMIPPAVAGLLCLLYFLLAAICVEITARKFERMELT